MRRQIRGSSIYSKMKIGHYYDALDLHRKEKIVYAQFLKPHRVLSTCRCNGGLREDLEFLYNHQSCEPSNHTGTDLCEVAVGDPQRYHKRITSKAGIDPPKSAGLGTAANMRNACVATASFQDLEVVAVSTAGVGGNASRAGDPAAYYQSAKGPVTIKGECPMAGTINTLLFVSQELTPGAMLAAATVATETKAALLQELSIPSRYANGIATGTGTDQLGIASQTRTPIVHVDANKHSKTGELIAHAVRQSLQDALNLQGGMTPDNRRSTIALLQRFGETQESFIQGVVSHLDESKQALFRHNFLSSNHDPLAVAATQALVHLRDQIAWGVLPQSCIHEILLNYASHIAKIISQKEIALSAFSHELGDLNLSTANDRFLTLIHKAFAIGFSRKWEGRFED